ncbi:MAG: transketolase [Parcubacteria group bacterium Licking1014_1]|nr:MAG: transketolase [Parcubacteria group bacterium Licking1014_1]
MKKEFIDTLIKLAEKDKNIYLLTGDLGFSFFEEFAKKFPQRFINCGVAEQNMMGVAAGLALGGKKVYVYSIIPFVTFRCLEQIRNDVCYQNLDVKIIGAGTGFSYGSHGATHFAIEDIAALRVLPNMTILSPADPTEMKQLVLQSYKIKSPTYIRFEKNTKDLHSHKDKITLGKPSVFKNGKDGLIITTGASLETGINVVKKLSDKKYNFKLISLHTLKPIDEKILVKEMANIKFIFTLEENRIIGGLGSAVGEILLRHNISNVTFKNMGISDKYSPVIGKQEYLRKYYKIDEDSVYKKILNALRYGN